MKRSIIVLCLTLTLGCTLSINGADKQVPDNEIDQKAIVGAIQQQGQQIQQLTERLKRIENEKTKAAARDIKSTLEQAADKEKAKTEKK